MGTITLSVPDELKEKMSKTDWINWSSVAREAFVKRMKQLELLEKLESEGEKELTKWSVKLGRKAKKGRFKRLLSEVPPEIREKLLNTLSPEERDKLLE